MQWNAAMRTRTHFKTHFVSLVSVVQSRCVRSFFASTESQESKSEVGLCNGTRQCAPSAYFALKHTDGAEIGWLRMDAMFLD